MRMPPRRSQRRQHDTGVPRETRDTATIDYVCSSCGRVVAGPDEGEIVEDPEHVSEVNGHPVSHTHCEDCQTDFEAELAARYGPDWYERVNTEGV